MNSRESFHGNWRGCQPLWRKKKVGTPFAFYWKLTLEKWDILKAPEGALAISSEGSHVKFSHFKKSVLDLKFLPCLRLLWPWLHPQKESLHVLPAVIGRSTEFQVFFFFQISICVFWFEVSYRLFIYWFPVMIFYRYRLYSNTFPMGADSFKH